MNLRTVSIESRKLDLQPREILNLQGIPEGADLSSAVHELVEEAIEQVHRMARPAGLYTPLGRAELMQVFHGEGRNEPVNPLQDIFRRGEVLALFALTLGTELSEFISGQFRGGDPAAACMLDSAASAAAELTADLLQSDYEAQLPQKKGFAVVRYSPGYCGWHLSGQKALFERLDPERIGLTLTDSCLMQPMKSISGVFVGGPVRIHLFSDSYDFCEECRTRVCRHRIRQVLDTSYA